MVIRSLIINFENYNPITLQPAYKSYKNSGENWNEKKKIKTLSLLHFKNHIMIHNCQIKQFNTYVKESDPLSTKFTLIFIQNNSITYVRIVHKTSLSRSQELCIKSYVTFTHVFKRRTIMHVHIYIKAYFSRISP